ncbi:NAD(P)-binding domain-containing protein [Brachybacterium sp. AOP42-C2-15]
MGGQLVRAVIAQGHQVVIADSRGPEILTALIDALGPAALSSTSITFR